MSLYISIKYCACERNISSYNNIKKKNSFTFLKE